jgi:hypothetical protein
VGLTRDGQGRLIAVVAICKGYINGLTLYRDDTDDSDSHKNDRGSWESSSPIEASARLTLSDPESGWSATTPLVTLESGHRFTIYGWTDDSKWTAGGPSFRASDLKRLDQEHVLFAPSMARDTETDHGLISADRFRSLACG